MVGLAPEYALDPDQKFPDGGTPHAVADVVEWLAQGPLPSGSEPCATGDERAVFS
jgi:hypothetical protein